MSRAQQELRNSIITDKEAERAEPDLPLARSNHSFRNRRSLNPWIRAGLNAHQFENCRCNIALAAYRPIGNLPSGRSVRTDECRPNLLVAGHLGTVIRPVIQGAAAAVIG